MTRTRLLGQQERGAKEAERRSAGEGGERSREKLGLPRREEAWRVRVRSFVRIRIRIRVR